MREVKEQIFKDYLNDTKMLATSETNVNVIGGEIWYD